MAELAPRDLTVVIPTHERWDILARTLAALRAQTVTGFRTVVVVDGDAHEPPALDADTVIAVPHGGPGAARNRAVAGVDTPLVLFLGDDIIPTSGFVAAHLARHHGEPDVNVAVLGHSAWHADVQHLPVNRWLDWSDNQFDYANIAGADAGWGRFYSSNVSLKRALFDQVGGFDEVFTYDYEDLDLAYRLHEAGLQLRYEPRALAHHLHAYDIPAIRRRFAAHGEGERRMADKHAWFQPFFRHRIRVAEQRPPVLALWPRIAGVAERGPQKVRTAVRERADAWYHQQLSGPFFGGWHRHSDVAELRTYLGDDYDESKLYRHRELVDAEEEAAPDEATFYRTSSMYLYDLTMFAAWGTKNPYLAAVRRLMPVGASVLDYGCGIGTDGLRLRDEGYRVAFADFDNPSTHYLRWRLAQRVDAGEPDSPVYDVDGEVPGGFDAVICFDVVEHVDDPFAFLATLEQKARTVFVNLLEPEPGDTHLHRPLPIDDLIAHAQRKGLMHYARYEHRSHLIAYVTDGSVPAAASRRVRRAGRRKILAERLTGLPPAV